MTVSTFKKLVCVIMLCSMLVMSMKGAEGAALTCGGVTKSLAPCMAYLRGPGGPSAPPRCCAGVRNLKGIARTPADRKTACNCMKTAANGIKGLNYGNAAKLPTQCGVSMSYSFSPNVNCNTVQ